MHKSSAPGQENEKSFTGKKKKDLPGFVKGMSGFWTQNTIRQQYQCIMKLTYNSINHYQNPIKISKF
jgi:hypothetical protein